MTLDDLLRAHRDRVADGITVKLQRVGGITRAMLIRDVAVELGVEVTVEDAGGASLVTAAIVARRPRHARAACGCTRATSTRGSRSITAPACRPRADGAQRPPAGAGLGIDVDLAALGDPIVDVVGVERRRMTEVPRERRGRRARSADAPAPPPPEKRSLRYRSLENPFPPLEILSADQVAQLHASALTVLEEHGIRVLLPEAREVFRTAGAEVDEETMLVRFAPELVEQSLALAPASFELIGRAPERTVTLGGRHLATVPVSSPPAVSDLDGGKRSGNLADFRDLVRLTQHFDVMHVTGPCVEPQDVPVQFRHLQSNLAYLTLTDKAPYLYARGRGQVRGQLRDVPDRLRPRRGGVPLHPMLLHGDQQQLAHGSSTSRCAWA